MRGGLLAEIRRQRKDGIDKAQFETCKNMMYGAAIADLESFERVAALLSSSYFRGRTPAQELEAIAAVEYEDVQQALETMLLEENCATVVVMPTE